MSQQFTMSNGVLLTIPGSYATISVVPGAANLASNGVLTLIGEANAGPDYTLEPSITNNFFLPSQYSAVLQKYQSGNLVDAFKNALTPSNDPAITGAPSAIYIVKTNPSLKASYTIVDQGFGNYGLLDDRSWGSSGNSIFGTLSPATVEVASHNRNLCLCSFRSQRICHSGSSKWWSSRIARNKCKHYSYSIGRINYYFSDWLEFSYRNFSYWWRKQDDSIFNWNY